MKTLKGWIPTIGLMIVVLMGSTVAKADGVVIGGGFTGEEPQQCATTNDSSLTGVVIGGFTGVVIGGFTGVVIGGGYTDGCTDSNSSSATSDTANNGPISLQRGGLLISD